MVFNYNVMKENMFKFLFDLVCMLNHDYGNNVGVFLSQTLLLAVISKWCCKKKPCNKHVVVEADELLLRVDIIKQGGDEYEEMVYRINMGQANNEEGGEEVVVVDVQRLDA